MHLHKLLSQHKNQIYWMEIIFCCGTKCLSMFGLAKHILESVEGQGSRTKTLDFSLIHSFFLVWHNFFVVSTVFLNWNQMIHFKLRQNLTKKKLTLCSGPGLAFGFGNNNIFWCSRPDDPFRVVISMTFFLTQTLVLPV